MMDQAKIIDGKALSKKLREGLAARAVALKGRGIVPGLAVILIGDSAASKVYVSNKIKACEECGVHSSLHALPRIGNSTA